MTNDMMLIVIISLLLIRCILYCYWLTWLLLLLVLSCWLLLLCYLLIIDDFVIVVITGYILLDGVRCCWHLFHFVVDWCCWRCYWPCHLLHFDWCCVDSRGLLLLFVFTFRFVHIVAFIGPFMIMFTFDLSLPLLCDHVVVVCMITDVLFWFYIVTLW